ncbi:helix-turn-helix domain-containing protein [Romeria aff. gracilis LEGE 07310]|uniref:Helix-turn-helix domain-containing protein n=1 Tax=Vasconcelosia minhoensis LEGE 07310 TaxID=915328 RepID=A0A8J7A4N1_9CYAN|nr:XRE family transcriptional regulator [Romeria gracilis]MBE9075775.1 helix-turn-helix domain-containing protein [Romeria aff. gracilis LEGE 07310]
MVNPAVHPTNPDADLDHSLERYLGHTLRELRQKHGLTLAEVADQSGVSRGMLSKIENAQTATSLSTLAKIAAALGVSMAALFRNYDMPTGGAQLVKQGEGMEVVRRGTKCGHTYHLLAYGQGPTKLFEPFLITLDDASEVFPTFEHPGVEFIYMLTGKLEYRHGQQTYLLEPGDALTLRGEIPHGPERLIELPIQFITTIYYGEQMEDQTSESVSTR